MRFRSQLILGGSALVTLTLLSGILAVVTLVASTNHVNDLTQHVVDDLGNVQDVRVQAEQLVATARGYLLTGDERFHAQLLDGQRELDRSLDRFRGPTMHPELRAQLARLQETFRAYSRATVNAVRDGHTRGSVEALEAAFEQQVEPHRNALDDAADELASMEQGDVRSETRHAGNVIRGFAIILFVAWSVGLLCCTLFGFVIVRKLNNQYERVEAAEAAATRAASSRKQVLDIVAHDLLSPLNTIVLGAESMSLRGVAARELGPITRAAHRMHRLIDDLIDVSRAEQLSFRLDVGEHPVDDLFDATLEQFRQRADAAGVTLASERSPGQIVRVDRDRAVQVLSNFVGNALRVVPRGGSVTLAAREHDGRVRLAVADTGPGIAAAEIPSLFAAYRQGSSAARSGRLGLGLFICKALVEAHSGSIGVDSQVGVGSTFWFEVPL